jgi:tRNA(Ile)-lysidine synthase
MKRLKKSLPSSDSTLRSKGAFSPFARAFLRRVQNAAHTARLWESEKSFIVGVSGGPDSLCLLDVFVALAEKQQFRLHIAHVNYRLRGDESDLDEALVRERAAAYGIPCTVLRPKKTAKGNLEEALREQRYAFFERLRKKLGYDLVAVAHHEDDQAETVLLRLLRGSGLRGLSAMLPRNGWIVRPLLSMSRQDILRYLKDQKLPYREDESNTDQRFMRNRIRHELIPFIERGFQPNVRKVLARSASVIASDYSFIKTAHHQALKMAHASGKTVFSRDEAVTLPRALLARELRTLFVKFSGGKAPEKGIVDEWMKVLRSEKKKSQTVTTRGLKLERKGDRVTLLKSDR